MRTAPLSRAAIPALVLGALLVLLGVTLAPGYACTDVGSDGPPPGGIEFHGIQHGDIVWTPDGGVNTCSIDSAILLTPLGVIVGLFGSHRLRSR